MEFGRTAKAYEDVPLSRHLVLDLLAEYKRPNDKISELMKEGELIPIRRGLYVPGPASDIAQPEPFLIANHLRGPSYVSLESALAYWNMIPERVYEVSSVTIKTSKKYRTPVGRFSYQYLPSPYYSFGIKRVQLSERQQVLMASPEKALCDKIVLTSGIVLRSTKQTCHLLLEDLRMEDDLLRTLDISMIQSWVEDAPKQNSIKMLIKTLHEL